jgi:gliding-associated putative ABC transporter substrate-binding component GldG
MRTPTSFHLPASVDRRIVGLALFGCLVLLNVVGLAYFGRIDLTRNKEYTLSPATKTALRHLKDPVTIRAYFTSDLPPPHASQARYVRDLLESFYTEGHGKIRFEFIDPMAQTSAEEADRKNQLKRDIFGNTVREATDMERELESMGIPPVQVRVNQADKMEVKRGYMGLALTYQEKREVIPVVAETQGLEYDITSMIKRLAQDKSQKLAIVRGHDGDRAPLPLNRALSALKEHYDLADVDLKEAGTLLPDADALLVVGPTTPFTDEEKRTLEAFVHAGHSAAFFLPPVHAQLQGLQAHDNNHGLGDMLSRWGVSLEPGLVLDAACATIGVQQQSGFMRVNQPVRYPFIAQIEQGEDSPITQGVRDAIIGFAGPLKITAPQGGDVHASVLVRTSPKSWVMPAPFNLDPMQKWAPSATELAPRDVVVTLDGPMATLPKAAGAKGSETSNAAPAAPARVLVAATESLMVDDYMNKGNDTLLLNMMDWLMNDDSLLAVRSRGMAAAPLKDVGEARRRTLKYGNILGLPLGFVALGALRWRRRQERRAHHAWT